MGKQSKKINKNKGTVRKYGEVKQRILATEFEIRKLVEMYDVEQDETVKRNILLKINHLISMAYVLRWVVLEENVLGTEGMNKFIKDIMGR